MVLVHLTPARDAACNACVDLCEVGSADAAADLMIMTAGSAEVSIHLMTNPAFGASAVGIATASAIGDDTTAAGGTAAKFKIQDRDNDEIFQGSVTASAGGGDIELDNVTVAAGVTVSITAFTYESTD